VVAQDIESMVKEKPVRFSGSLNAQFLSYATTRERPSRDPFVWTISGAPTVSIYGFSIPFSFVFSQKQRDFRQPFNQFGMSPYYKWVKFHFGYRNINFSRYTMAGHTFLGAGVEATPGNFRFGFVYGRFLKAVEDDSLNLEYVIPAFKRNGYSVKVGYGTQSNYVDLIMFKAKDDATSIQADSTLAIAPAENLVFGIKTFQRFLKRFTLDLDFGYSIFTNNLNATEVGLPDIPLQSFINALTTVNNSTTVNWAGNGSLNYSQGVFGLRFRYQRIQPEYQTMGAYFFNNDLEQITFDPSVHLFQRKLNIRGSVGFQKNNLGGDKVNDTFRQINSINVSYSSGQKFTVNASYMNYRIDQSRNPLIIKDFVDSLKMKQVSTNFSINMNYNLGTQEMRSTVSIGTYYQKYNDENPNTEVFNTSSSQSPFVSYRFNNTAAKFSVYGRLNYNFFETAMNTQSRLGLTVGGSKRMANEKLNLNASGTYYNNKTDKESNGATSMVRVQLNYRVVKSHNVNFSLNYINREFKSDASNNFNEFLIRFGYAMRIR
jgi:hypothetical protein